MFHMQYISYIIYRGYILYKRYSILYIEDTYNNIIAIH